MEVAKIVCFVLMLSNFPLCVLALIKDMWNKATFHLVLGTWMWYIVIM